MLSRENRLSERCLSKTRGVVVSPGGAADLIFRFIAESVQAEDLLSTYWVVTIEGLEFGNTPAGPGGIIEFYDQGAAWTINVDYVYLTYE